LKFIPCIHLDLFLFLANNWQKESIETKVTHGDNPINVPVNCPTVEDAVAKLRDRTFMKSFANSSENNHIAVRFKIAGKLNSCQLAQPRPQEFEDSLKPLVVAFESNEFHEKSFFWKNSKQSELSNCVISSQVSEQVMENVLEFIGTSLKEELSGEFEI
jgi:hypothetical protein